MTKILLWTSPFLESCSFYMFFTFILVLSLVLSFKFWLHCFVCYQGRRVGVLVRASFDQCAQWFRDMASCCELLNLLVFCSERSLSVHSGFPSPKNLNFIRYDLILSLPSLAVVYLAIWAWIWNEVVSITILLLLVIIIIISSSKLIIIVTIITCLPPLKWNVNSFIFIGTPWQAVCCFRKSRYLPVSFYGTLKNFKSSLSTFFESMTKWLWIYHL